METTENSITYRIEAIEKWLKENDANPEKKQSHLITDSTERIYWHLGYLMALKDALRLVRKETSCLN